MAFGTAYANAELNAIYSGSRGNVRLSLHNGPAGTDGANEIAGVARIDPVGRMGTAANKQIANNQVLEWTNVPADTIAEIGCWIDDVFYKSGDVDPDVVTQSGNTFRIAVGGFVDIWD